MPASLRKPKEPRAPKDPVPDRLELRCACNAITLEAAAPEGEGEVIPRFSMVAYTGDAMRVEGWRHPVVVELAGMTIPSQRRPVRFGHSMYAGIGHTERIAIEGGRLIAEGIVSRDTQAAREVVSSGKRGFPWQASIGAQVAQADFIRAGKSVTVNSRTFDGPVYVARRTVLGEISFVDLGADGNTSAAIAAQSATADLRQENTDMDETTATQTEETTTGEAAPIQAAADAGKDTSAADALTAIRAQALAETKRLSAVRRICAGKFPEIEEKAIAEGWSTDKCELEVLRASRPKAPAIHAVDTALWRNSVRSNAA